MVKERERMDAAEESYAARRRRCLGASASKGAESAECRQRLWELRGRRSKISKGQSEQGEGRGGQEAARANEVVIVVVRCHPFCRPLSMVGGELAAPVANTEIARR